MRSITLGSALLITHAFLSFGAEPSPGRQVEMSLKANGKEIPYLFYLPKEYETTGTNRWPLMLFLHGRGESQGPLSLVAKWGPPRRIEHGDHFPFLVVSPQCPTNDSWPQATQQKLLVALLDHVEKTYRVDANRVYLTGLSMGGFGTWRLAADLPERFAAAVPICGVGQPTDAGKLKNLPIWVFHGTEDKAVPFKASESMVEALKNAGSKNVRFTRLDFIGHNSWEAAYATPELYEWLAQQRASRNTAR